MYSPLSSLTFKFMLTHSYTESTLPHSCSHNYFPGLHESCVGAEERSREKEWRPKHTRCPRYTIIALHVTAWRGEQMHDIISHTIRLNQHNWSRIMLFSSGKQQCGCDWYRIECAFRGSGFNAHSILQCGQAYSHLILSPSHFPLHYSWFILLQ